MRPDSERRQSRRSAASKSQPRILVDGSPATLVNFSSGGLRVESGHILSPDALVQVSGEVEGSGGPLQVTGRCRVRWCSDVGQALFHAGLSFENASDVPFGAAGVAGTGVDHYQTLQVSRRADSPTICKAYHQLAQRCRTHAFQASQAEFFSRMEQAHAVLCNRSRRVFFDIQLASRDRVRLYLFENWQNSRSEPAEVLKRHAILRLLYRQYVNRPGRPGIALCDLEESMGCPSEYLEFSLWVLRQSKLAKLGDTALYEITRRGVAAVNAAPAAPVASDLPLAGLDGRLN